jgi:hypothetical protein
MLSRLFSDIIHLYHFFIFVLISAPVHKLSSFSSEYSDTCGILPSGKNKTLFFRLFPVRETRFSLISDTVLSSLDHSASPDSRAKNAMHN